MAEAGGPAGKSVIGIDWLTKETELWWISLLRIVYVAGKLDKCYEKLSFQNIFKIFY